MVLDRQAIGWQVELVGQPRGVNLIIDLNGSPVLEAKLLRDRLHGLIEPVGIDPEVSIAAFLADSEQVGKEEGAEVLALVLAINRHPVDS